MSILSKDIDDKKVLRLIRKYLQSGVMINGVVAETDLGCPQGGPASILLSNIYLNELDKELKLKINLSKSKVTRPWKLKYLSFSFYNNKDGIQVRIHPKAIEKLKKRGLSKQKAWEYANTRRSYWRISKSPIMNIAYKDKDLENLGLISITKYYLGNC